MPAIGNFPPYALNAVYSPVEFTVLPLDIIAPAVKASAKIFINDTEVSEVYTSVKNGSGLYEFDVSETLQDYLEYYLNTLDGGGEEINTDEQIKFYVYFYEWYIDPTTNLLTRYPIVASSYEYVGVAAIRPQRTKTKYLNEELLISAGSTKKFMTNKPNPCFVKYSENEWLGCYLGVVNINAYRVRVFDSNGALVSTGYKLLSALTYTAGAAPTIPYVWDNGRRNLGIGGANINSTTFDYGSATIASSTGYYDVVLGELTVSGGVPTLFVNYSEVRRYNIVSDCSLVTRIHFLNQFGGYDSVTFRNLMEEELVSNFREYEKPQPFDREYSYSSKGKIESVGRFESVLAYPIRNDAEAKWLQELLISPKVFIETNELISGGAYYPIMIDETRQRIVENIEDGSLYWVLSVYDPNELITQKA